jgi:adenine-specific DNA-methyltransferase
MVRLLSAGTTERILEPCSGAGVFLDALADAGFQSVTAIEIDPDLARHEKVKVRNESFVAYRTADQFRAVIGNPPYIRWKDLSELSKEEMQNHLLFGSLFNSLSDYLTVFIAGSIELLEEGGELVFITPSFWMHTQHSAPLREWMLKRGQVTSVVDFGEATVFDKVSSAIVIFKFVKGERGREHAVLHRYVGPRRVPATHLDLSDSTMFVESAIQSFSMQSHWSLSTDEELEAANALEQDCSISANDFPSSSRHATLGEIVDIANGMVSGLDKAFRIHQDLEQVLNGAEREARLPVIKAFALEPLMSPTITGYINIPTGLSEDQVEEMYPHFYAHLLSFRTELESRYSYGRDLPFWEWAFRRSEKFFMSPIRKGFVPCKERLTNRSTARFSLTSEWAVATQDVTGFQPLAGVRESIEYIVAYLNHEAVTDWVRVRGLMKGDIAEFSERPLASIPFRSINWDDAAERELHDTITCLMQSLSTISAKENVVSDLVDMFAVLLPGASKVLRDRSVIA